MPIRKSQRRRYPTNWRAISARIRFGRAEGRCECLGECGDLAAHRWLDEEVRRCPAVHGQVAPLSQARVVLTVAHLDHQPENCADENLKAMCQRCHLAYDQEHHQASAAETRKGRVRS